MIQDGIRLMSWRPDCTPPLLSQSAVAPSSLISVAGAVPEWSADTRQRLPVSLEQPWRRAPEKREQIRALAESVNDTG